MARPLDKPPVRPNVILEEETAQMLYDICKARGDTVTTTVRRAIRLLHAIEKENREGNQLAIEAPDGRIIGKVVVL
ncbi:ribbon-helix-helix DNA binding domain protein [Gordonia phage RedWattleHog]|uniref:Ribbon-helix-helix DNA binding domain protein n=1 Tax=Gordonia phage Stormageddon TaxID=2656541 RepID=A0A649VSP9_9CAUD|nr:ribbon-helix-helix DNA binding domain protein [Gordonia phage Stormageddon]QGJ94962.1 ribbon-helix-helix DNA binding domain protein [Gordonia phage Stormageddon]QLF83606.1 ribbon-helix-helix DNA binding domain protein [Gordonia phage RedWattleHog]